MPVLGSYIVNHHKRTRDPPDLTSSQVDSCHVSCHVEAGWVGARAAEDKLECDVSLHVKAEVIRAGESPLT